MVLVKLSALGFCNCRFRFRDYRSELKSLRLVDKVSVRGFCEPSGIEQPPLMRMDFGMDRKSIHRLFLQRVEYTVNIRFYWQRYVTLLWECPQSMLEFAWCYRRPSGQSHSGGRAIVVGRCPRG